MQSQRILIIATAHARMGDSGKPTGVWLEELAVPYYAFIDAGARVDVATVAGMPVPVDPNSLKPRGENAANVERWLDDAQAAQWTQQPLDIEALRAADYDAVFLPGGHGAMWDLPASAALAALIGSAWDSGKVVAAVCHGPAGLTAAIDNSGRPIVAGRRVTAFTNREEDAVGLSAVVPFLLESRLRELGARFEPGPDFEPHAIADGRLVTGQNPASSARAAALVLQALAAPVRADVA